MSDQPVRMSEEDQFAAAVEQSREKPDAAPEAPPADARDAQGTDMRTDAQRARDESGRFAPSPPPFEGFDKLTPEAQAYLTKLQTEHKRAQNQAAAARRDLANARRPAPQPRTQGAAPPPRQTPAPQPQPRKVLEKWEAGRKEHPEFFESLEERIKAAEEESGRALTAAEQRIATLEQQAQDRLSRVETIASRFEQREAEESKAHARSLLSEISPNWEVTVGWKDEAGNPVPPDQQVYHPHFSAWLESLPPKVRQLKEGQLDSGDGELIGNVLQEFDYLHEWAMTGVKPDRAPPSGTPAAPRPTPNPRAAALNDRQPRPGTGGAPPPRDVVAPASRYEAEEAAFAAAATPENMKRFRGVR